MIISLSEWLNTITDPYHSCWKSIYPEKREYTQAELSSSRSETLERLLPTHRSATTTNSGLKDDTITLTFEGLAFEVIALA